MKIIQKKVCMLGDFAVGKTSLVRRFVEGIFEDKYLTTVGVKISQKTITKDDKQLKMILWDLSGGSEFEGVVSSYMRGSAGGLVVCDLTRKDTLTRLEQYCDAIRKPNPDVKLLMVANKMDLKAERQIDEKELESIKSKLGLDYCLTSAKSGENVEVLFERLMTAFGV